MKSYIYFSNWYYIQNRPLHLNLTFLRHFASDTKQCMKENKRKDGIMYIKNSLTGKMEPLVPRSTSTVSNLLGMNNNKHETKLQNNQKFSDKNNNNEILYWYSCGPTVYDDAHLGHARTFVSQDILRRVLSDYYNYEIYYALGITDVDDKIINRAKEEKKCFQKLAKDYENKFFNDLNLLNVQIPNTILRVSEHINDIIHYIKKIKDNNYAYEMKSFENKDKCNDHLNSTGTMENTGIYFDTEALGSNYGKLVNKNNLELNENVSNNSNINETKNNKNRNEVIVYHEKRNSKDFCLWKNVYKNNKNNVGWDSDFGFGRPGWHIECNAMIYRVFGKYIDLHTGGIDLMFPHHNNEVAQADAYNNDEKIWCNHFVHFGHLYIKGLKMSKSLKNFISIQDYFKNMYLKNTNYYYKSDVFRIFCLIYKYNSNVHFSELRIKECSSILDKFINFLICDTNIHNHNNTNTIFFCEKRNELYQMFIESKNKIRYYLSDDLNTPEVINLLSNLIQFTHSYTFNKNINIDMNLIESIKNYIKKMLLIFGIHSETLNNNHVIRNDKTYNKEIIDALVTFRSKVRENILINDNINSKKNLLEACDHLRNELMKMNIEIDDIQKNKSLWKYNDHLKLNDNNNKEIKDLNKAGTNKMNTLTTEELKQIPLKDLFKKHPRYQSFYSKYDLNGLPTHDIEGNELSKTKRNKLEKRYKKHELLLK